MNWSDEGKKRNPNWSHEWLNEFRSAAYDIARPMRPEGKKRIPAKDAKVLTEQDWDRAAELATKAMQGKQTWVNLDY